MRVLAAVIGVRSRQALLVLALTFATMPFANVFAQQAPTAGARAGTAAGGQAAGDAAEPARPRINALLVSGGCCHAYTEQDKLAMEVLGRGLPIDWTVIYQGGTARESKIPFYANPNWIKGFQIVFHNECFGMVDDPAYIRTITDAHRSTGIPAVFTHCSVHSYRATSIDDWRELLGVRSMRHTKAHPIAVKWVNPANPITAGLAADWTTPVDELYVIEKTWPTMAPLATAVSPEEGHAVYPVVWTNEFGGGRVFGTTLGHAGTWTDPVFQELLTRGFRWALKMDVTAAPAAAK